MDWVTIKFEVEPQEKLDGNSIDKPHSNVFSELSMVLEKISKRRPPIMKVELYDTTLRDGNQCVGVNFSVDDKLKVARLLSEFGIEIIEGGWPSESNPSEAEFFKRCRKEGVTAAVSAIGATRKAHTNIRRDRNLEALLSVESDYVTLVGKSWKLHVENILDTTLKENLRMITESVEYLKDHGCKVIFDAEHFFDGFKDDPAYSVHTLKAAIDGGASTVVLCDTRGGSTPDEVYEVTSYISKIIDIPIGIHAHNDRGLATANSIFAIMAGAEHFQGTVNGIGERCGNANIIEFIGNLEFSLGYRTGLDLKRLTQISEYVYDIANLTPNSYMPFVGKYAFAHKAGIHGHAVVRLARAYESIDPNLVGNTRSVTVSGQAGLTSVISKAQQLGYRLEKSDSRAKELLLKIKRMDSSGYNLENANATLELLYARTLGEKLDYFSLINWRAFVTGKDGDIHSESTVKLRIGGESIIMAGEGNGPVNAFDNALRRALETHYPKLSKVRLIGYRVREIDVERGTGAAVRVFIEFEADGERWSTAGVSTNILKASEEALLDGYIYFLYKHRVTEGV
ncbi:MAG: citramalate synthase [Candidatus Bathyarchaeia archaeon]